MPEDEVLLNEDHQAVPDFLGRTLGAVEEGGKGETAMSGQDVEDLLPAQLALLAPHNEFER